jgi:hypothetical protein
MTYHSLFSSKYLSKSNSHGYTFKIILIGFDLSFGTIILSTMIEKLYLNMYVGIFYEFIMKLILKIEI